MQLRVSELLTRRKDHPSLLSAGCKRLRLIDDRRVLLVLIWHGFVVLLLDFFATASCCITCGLSYRLHLVVDWRWGVESVPVGCMWRQSSGLLEMEMGLCTFNSHA